MVALVIGRVAVALVAPVAGQAALLAPAVVRVAVVMLALVAGQAGQVALSGKPFVQRFKVLNSRANT